MNTLAADLGGTRLKAGLLVDGAPTDVAVVDHGGEWLPALRSALVSSGADELALCVPGIVDGGRVVALPGKLPGLENASLTGLLGVRVGVVVNDAVAYGVGEAVRGAGVGLSRVVVVTLGTGVGVVVIEDGSPLGRGPLGGGILGGQLPLGGGGVDSTGRAGTIEALCRADALTAHGIDVYRADLVRALTALCLAHAPDGMVVGGGAAQPGLLDGVEEQVRAGLWPGQSVVVRVAALGDAAGLHGLAVLAAARVDA